MKSDIFLLAAQIQARYEQGMSPWVDGVSRFSCDNLDRAFLVWPSITKQEYFDLYTKYFEPDDHNNEIDLGWWDFDDNESRIWALLFMVEIVKDLNGRERKKKSNRK